LTRNAESAGTNVNHQNEDVFLNFVTNPAMFVRVKDSLMMSIAISSNIATGTNSRTPNGWNAGMMIIYEPYIKAVVLNLFCSVDP
jgi:hypothetical protein